MMSLFTFTITTLKVILLMTSDWLTV